MYAICKLCMPFSNLRCTPLLKGHFWGGGGVGSLQQNAFHYPFHYCFSKATCSLRKMLFSRLEEWKRIPRILRHTLTFSSEKCEERHVLNSKQYGIYCRKYTVTHMVRHSTFCCVNAALKSDHNDGCGPLPEKVVYPWSSKWKTNVIFKNSILPVSLMPYNYCGNDGGRTHRMTSWHKVPIKNSLVDRLLHGVNAKHDCLFLLIKGLE